MVKIIHEKLVFFCFVFFQENVCFGIISSLVIFMVLLKQLCGKEICIIKIKELTILMFFLLATEYFPQLFNYSFLLMNLSVCGMLGIILGTLKCIALFWWNIW
jgi:hypothetical protein